MFREVFNLLLLFSYSQVQSQLPSIGLNVIQLIRKQGYPVESHKIVTEDGYVLQTIRIPFGKGKVSGPRPPVLTFSGIVCSCADWVNMGENSLGFMLADQGYDVWLGNVRGSTLSRKHLVLSPTKQPKMFWNYTVHDVGYYDVPANIDYIKNLTKQESIFYIGYSHGATIGFVMTSTRPQYNENIRLMVALGPGMYLHNTKFGLVDFLSTYMVEIEALIDRYELYEWLPHRSFLVALVELLCNDRSPLRFACGLIMLFIGGYSPEHLNTTMIPIIVSNTPAGASFNQLKHYSQIYSSKNFQQFDYGKEENLRIYGKENPPIYNTSKISAPVAIYYGDADALISVADFKLTASKLPNLVFMKRVRGFNHLDIMWAVDVVPFVSKSILKLMKRY